jgi:hypothetical protein
MIAPTELAVLGEHNGNLSLYDQIGNPLEFIKTMGTALAQSKIAGCKSAADGQVIAWACLSKRKDPFEIAQRYHLIEGKLAIKAEQMLADFRTKFGGKSRWIKTGVDGIEAEIELTGPDGQVIQYAFNIATAKAAKYVKDGSQWQKRPDQMLRSRCITDAMRMGWPEISGGNYSEDEIYDVVEATATVVRSKPKSNTEQTTKATTSAATETIVDVTAEPSSKVATTEDVSTSSATSTEEPPFETGDVAEVEIESQFDTSDASFNTEIIEIQLIIDKLGSNVGQVCTTFNKKLGTTAATIEDFTAEQQAEILERLRTALAKFEQQQMEKLPN